ncbi:hypothetical protein DL767_004815 [Monosporascus sp. MG133]|nr:hypothetical protein DL767_004815 [Monosporascus sp. MG133]
MARCRVAEADDVVIGEEVILEDQLEDGDRRIDGMYLVGDDLGGGRAAAVREAHNGGYAYVGAVQDLVSCADTVRLDANDGGRGTKWLSIYG